MSAETARIAALRRLHAEARALGLATDDLRDIAAAAGYGSSLSALDAVQISKLTARMTGKVVITPNGNAPTDYLKFPCRPPDGKAALWGKLSRLLAGAGYTWEYADGMASRMFGVSSWQWLTASQLHKVCAALGYHAKARARRGEGGGAA